MTAAEKKELGSPAGAAAWSAASDAVILHWLTAFNQQRREHVAVTFEDGWRIIDWLEGCGPRLEALLAVNVALKAVPVVEVEGQVRRPSAAEPPQPSKDTQ